MNGQLAAAFFLQTAVVLAACRVVGLLARRVGQPQVVGEMIAGVLLGPSCFGWWWPELQAALFPKEVRPTLYVLGQLGVGLYMFLIGVEFRGDQFRQRAGGAVSVSLAGMLVPFAMGALLAPWLLATPGLFAERAQWADAALFLGAATAITAFPMLARILYERGLAGSALGTLALAAGAIDDAAAWCVLAVVLAMYPLADGAHAGVGVWGTLGGGFAYALVVLTVGRRALRPYGAAVERAGRLSTAGLGAVLTLFCTAAWLMDWIGMHAVFGGFVLGVAMPRGALAEQLRSKLEPVTVTLLLPMFFTCSGLNTQLDLIGAPELLMLTAAVLVASVLGKGVACAVAARLAGEPPRSALAIGALMNARGLMELILIDAGLQRGVIGKPLFAMLATMAIVTTLMATPLFELVLGRRRAT